VATRVQPFLMFHGKAEAAVNFYLSLFPGSELVDLVRYGPGQPGPEGSVMKAVFSLQGQKVMCTDSVVKHDFTFTPAFSFFVDCESEDEIGRLSVALASRFHCTGRARKGPRDGCRTVEPFHSV
jgi:predicted 3-demethylubiquinone-9 3-methyltransferase (glyoxalase superfamily)